MDHFPPLYKINKQGKLRKWEISIIKNDVSSYSLVTSYNDVTINKNAGHQIQRHKRVVDKGKSNRTIEQQVVAEAQSKWNEEKNRETYVESIDACVQLEFRPMLANTFDASLYKIENKSRAFKMTFPVLVQPKLDGIRCVSSRIGSVGENEIVMKSRKGVEIHHFKEIKEEIKVLFSRSSNNNLIFDGELFTTTVNFETISGIVRQVNASLDSKKLIEYHIYDVYDPMNVGCSFVDRFSFLRNLFTNDSVFFKIKLVETRYAADVHEIEDAHECFVKEGFEGVMIRQEKGIYEENKRSKFLQKHKSFLEEEFEIVNIHDGEGNDNNLVIWECKTGTGKIFSVRPRGTFKEREILFMNASVHIGRYLTVILQEYSADGIPRFPVGKSIRDVSF
jgi:ATP-dependent DNA ligase